MKNKTVGIHIAKTATDTKIENCEFRGFDKAVVDEGKRTKILSSIFRDVRSLWPATFIGQLTIGVIGSLIATAILILFGSE